MWYYTDSIVKSQLTAHHKYSLGPVGVSLTIEMHVLTTEK
jgi:hypothetical protein